VYLVTVFGLTPFVHVVTGQVAVAMVVTGTETLVYMPEYTVARMTE
jgi:hypothetical protein